MTLFEAAQAAVLASGSETFRLDGPPSLGWWRARFQVSLAAAAFLTHYQDMLVRNSVEHHGVFWETGSASWWQAGAGLTPRQWRHALDELGPEGAALISFTEQRLGATRSTFIRPTDSLLAVFRLTLESYDAVIRSTLKKIYRVPPLGTPQDEQSDTWPGDEEVAETRWLARGASGKLRQLERLGTVNDDLWL